MNFGLPYMGSKTKLAPKLLQIIPAAENFYDLFGGGFSVTHCAAMHFKNKWQNFYFNEIKPGQTKFIQDCIQGKYNYKNFKPPFISRAEFFASNDPYVKIIWSFGNNGKDYLFNPELEIRNRSLHNAVVFNEFDDLAIKLIGHDKFYFDSIKDRRLSLKKTIKSIQLQPLERMVHMERLERLERLLKNLHFSELSYDQIQIKPDSVVYCDPPYIGTAKYSAGGFDHQQFYEWVRAAKFPVYFSEYRAPDDFRNLLSLEHRTTLAKNKNDAVEEKLFCNPIGYDLWLQSKRK